MSNVWHWKRKCLLRWVLSMKREKSWGQALRESWFLRGRQKNSCPLTETKRKDWGGRRTRNELKPWKRASRRVWSTSSNEYQDYKPCSKLKSMWSWEKEYGSYRHSASWPLRCGFWKYQSFLSFYHSASRTTQVKNFLGNANPWFDNIHHRTVIWIQ